MIAVHDSVAWRCLGLSQIESSWLKPSPMLQQGMERDQRDQPRDDLDIIAEVNLGKKEAYELLVRKYQVKIRSYCAQLLGDRSLAEDAAQDTFVKAYQSLHKFRGDASFSSWIYRIARNHCLDVLRKQSASRIEFWDVEPSESVATQLRPSASPPEITETRDYLTKLLGLLSSQNAEVLMLREMHGFSYGEVANICDCTVDAIKSRLKRARKEIVEKATLLNLDLEKEPVSHETL